MDLWQQIAEIPGVEVIDPLQPGLSYEDSLEPRRKGLLADVMIASTKHDSAPVKAIRVRFKTPGRFCNVWSIIEGQRFKGRIHVKIAGENLGY